MNKILIVGHPQAGLADVERLLRAHGMAAPRPSRREGLLPSDIAEVLCKAHGAPALNQLGKGQQVRQIGAAPLWHGLAMDLMLGNIDQPLWGWCDPQAVHLLDYWRELDPDLHFIFVYDQPGSTLTRLPLDEASRMTRAGLQRRIDGWVAYNSALSKFHQQHPERCLLVHSEQVRRSVETYLQQMQARINAPWPERLDGPHPDRAIAHAASALSMQPSMPAGHGLTKAHESAPLSESVLAHHVAGTLLRHQWECRALYDELQHHASLPLTTAGEDSEDPALSMQAWMSVVAQQERFQHQHALTLGVQLQYEAARREVLEHERQLAEERRMQQARQLEVAQSLEAVQGQVRSAHQQAKAADEAKQQACSQAQALQQQLRQLQKELSALRTQAASRPSPKDPPDMNDQVLQQLHLVQEELERYHRENKLLNARLQSGDLVDALTQRVWFGAGERVREDLAYRVGACLIRHSRSIVGWLVMPWALMGEVMRHRLTRAAREGRNLPPIEAYRDAHEAERVRQHLSYRLGQACLTHACSVRQWLKLPFALRRELQAFRKQLQT